MSQAIAQASALSVTPSVADVTVWSAERLVFDQYGRLPVLEAWADYTRWCADHSRPAGTRQYLGRWFTGQGVSRELLDGRVCLVGLRLVPAAGDEL